MLEYNVPVVLVLWYNIPFVVMLWYNVPVVVMLWYTVPVVVVLGYTVLGCGGVVEQSTCCGDVVVLVWRPGRTLPPSPRCTHSCRCCKALPLHHVPNIKFFLIYFIYFVKTVLR